MDEGLKRVIKRLLRLPADALVASSTKLPALIQGQIANHEAYGYQTAITLRK